MLEDHKIESARDLVGALLQLEDEFGLVPDMCDGGLWIDPKAKNAQKTDVAIKAWGVMRHRLITGRDHARGIRRLEEQVLDGETAGKIP